MPKNWSFIACCLSNLLFYTAVYVVIIVLPLYLIDEWDAEKSLAGVVLSLFTFAGMASRPFSGFLVDTFRRKPLYLVCYFLFTAHFVGYLLAGTLLTLAIVRAMHGAIFSIATTSATTVMVDLLPRDKQGRGIAIFGVTTSAGILFGPFTGLTVLEHYGFEAVFAVALVISTIALLIGTTIRFHENRERNMEAGSVATRSDRIVRCQIVRRRYPVAPLRCAPGFHVSKTVALECTYSPHPTQTTPTPASGSHSTSRSTGTHFRSISCMFPATTHATFRQHRQSPLPLA
jgi:MFS family permease